MSRLTQLSVHQAGVPVKNNPQRYNFGTHQCAAVFVQLRNANTKTSNNNLHIPHNTFQEFDIAHAQVVVRGTTHKTAKMRVGYDS
jgi:DNA-binding MltR family transcriptional regulator